MHRPTLNSRCGFPLLPFREGDCTPWAIKRIGVCLLGCTNTYLKRLRNHASQLPNYVSLLACAGAGRACESRAQIVLSPRSDWLGVQFAACCGLLAGVCR